MIFLNFLGMGCPSSACACCSSGTGLAPFLLTTVLKRIFQTGNQPRLARGRGRAQGGAGRQAGMEPAGLTASRPHSLTPPCYAVCSEDGDSDAPAPSTTPSTFLMAGHWTVAHLGAPPATTTP